MAGAFQFDTPTALDYFAVLVADDASFSVLEAAVAVAQDEHPALDVQGVLAQIDGLADRLRRRTAPDTAPLQRLRLMNEYFFQELGFAGNVNDYNDSRNSLLPDVLDTRRGIPLTLALLYIEIANQQGLQAYGVAFPGHFLIKLHMPRGEVVIDPFSGRSVGRQELEERLLPYRNQRRAWAQQGNEHIDDEVPLGLYLQPAPARDVIARLLRNLKKIHLSAEDWPRLQAVQQRLVVLLPDVWEEQRDHALVLKQLGHLPQAEQALRQYLQQRPNAADAPALRRALLRWQRLP